MARPWKLQARQSRRDRLWYVILAGGNGETVMRSAGLQLPAAAALIAEIEKAEIDVRVGKQCGTSPGWYVETHKSSLDDSYYNRLVHAKRSGETMGSEAYVRRDSAQRTAANMRDAMVITLPPLAAP